MDIKGLVLRWCGPRGAGLVGTTLCFLIGGLLLSGTAGGAVPSGGSGAAATPTTYYVDSTATCPGAGTMASPWCDFRVVNSTTFKAGDQLLLKRGDTFNSGMVLYGSGTPTSYLTVGAYGSGPRPIINGEGNGKFLGINLFNNSYVQIEHLSVENAGSGIFINDTSNQTGYRFLDLLLSGDALGLQSSAADSATASNVLIQDVEGSSNTLACRTDQCEGDTLALGGVSNVTVNRLYSHDSCSAMSWGLGPGSRNVVIENSLSVRDGGCPARLGSTANYLDGDTNVTYVNDMVTDVPNTGVVDFGGITIEPDTEPNKQINIEDDYIADNAGPGIEILGHSSPNLRSDISGNVLSDNSDHYGTSPWPILSQIWTDIWIPGSQNGTGAIENNLYYAPSSTGGFEEAHGEANFNGFAQSHNLGVAVARNVWYAANGFSCTRQGAHAWSYQLRPNNSAWTKLAACKEVNTLDEEWTTGRGSGFVSNFEERPPANPSSWVSRSWTSPATDEVSVRGRVLMTDPTCASGVTAEITKNGSSKPIWGPRTISGARAAGVDSNLDGISVHAGDVLHFAVQAKGSVQCRVSWTPSVAILRLMNSASHRSTGTHTDRR